MTDKKVRIGVQRELKNYFQGLIDRHVLPMYIAASELDTAVLIDNLSAGSIDAYAAWHKDVPCLPDALRIAASLARLAAHDSVFTLDAGSFDELREGSCIAVLSAYQHIRLRHGARYADIHEYRGSCADALAQVADGRYTALIAPAAYAALAALPAGVACAPLEPWFMMPEPFAGVISLFARSDEDVRGMLAALHDPATACMAAAEQALLDAIAVADRSRIGVLAQMSDGCMTLRCALYSVDGTAFIQLKQSCRADEYAACAARMAATLRASAPPGLV